MTEFKTENEALEYFHKNPVLIDFDLNALLKYANELVRADEAQMALRMLETCLPGFYRDNPPLAVVALKHEILSRISLPSTYANHHEEQKNDLNIILTMKKSLRGALIIEDVKRLNNNGLIPQIVDYGPGEYWLPIILKSENLNFKYLPIYLDQNAFSSMRQYFNDVLISTPTTDQPIMYTALEIIEHLWNENDIVAVINRLKVVPDIIHVSTPKYTYNVLVRDWREEIPELGHLRTYTPKEFSVLLRSMFPMHHHTYIDSKVMQMRMVYQFTPFQSILQTNPQDVLNSVMETLK
jgi:hypothetical protein